MTVFLFAIGVCCVAVSTRLAVRAAVIPRLALKQHLREIRDYGFESRVEERSGNPIERLRLALRRTAERLGRFMLRRFPSVTPLSAAELGAAGHYTMPVEVFHGYRAMAAVGLPIVFGLLILASGSTSAIGILLIVVSAPAGWILPSFVVRRRGTNRLLEVDLRLPELIDLLIATVEAGMGFTASLDLVANRFEGPIGEELKLTMKRQSLGLSVAQALEEMVERCDTPSVRAFVRTATRGETLGVSVGPVLRELSADQRRRHRQTARERMQKAPIKMLFPLMFLIFPALMIVLIFPAAYSIMTTLGGVF